LISGCAVLRTASVSISRSSAFVFAGSRGFGLKGVLNEPLVASNAASGQPWPGNFTVTHKTLPFDDVLECLLDLREDL
jgi:hypothetical protein